MENMIKNIDYTKVSVDSEKTGSLKDTLCKDAPVAIASIRAVADVVTNPLVKLVLLFSANLIEHLSNKYCSGDTQG